MTSSVRDRWYLMRLDQRLAWRLSRRERRDVLAEVRSALDEGATRASFGSVRALAAGYTEGRSIRLRPFGAIAGIALGVVATWLVAMGVRLIAITAGADRTMWVVGPFESRRVALLGDLHLQVAATGPVYATGAALGLLVGSGFIVRLLDRRTIGRVGIAMTLAAIALVPALGAGGAFERHVDAESRKVDVMLAATPGEGGIAVHPAFVEEAPTLDAGMSSPMAISQPSFIAGVPAPGDDVLAQPGHVTFGAVGSLAFHVREDGGEGGTIIVAHRLEGPGDQGDGPCGGAAVQLGSGRCVALGDGPLTIIDAAAGASWSPSLQLGGEEQGMRGISHVGVGDLDGAAGDEVIVLVHVGAPLGQFPKDEPGAAGRTRLVVLERAASGDGWQASTLDGDGWTWVVPMHVDEDRRVDLLAARESTEGRSELAWYPGGTSEAVPIDAGDGVRGYPVDVDRGRVLLASDDDLHDVRLRGNGRGFRAEVERVDLQSAVREVADAAYVDLDGRGAREVLVIEQVRGKAEGGHPASATRIEVVGAHGSFPGTPCIVDLGDLEPWSVLDRRSVGDGREQVAIAGAARSNGSFGGIEMSASALTWLGASSGTCPDTTQRPGKIEQLLGPALDGGDPTTASGVVAAAAADST